MNSQGSRCTISRSARLALAMYLGTLVSACSLTGRSSDADETVEVAHQRLSCGSGGSGGSGGSASVDDDDPGALIVDMGTQPQTQGNALKPYGMVYDLVKNAKVPVLWAYNTSKTSNTDTDFSVDGRAFKGSSFIIPGAFVSTAQATVNRWIAQGVNVYGPTQATFTPPTYFKRITGFPNIVLDPQNGPIAQAYLTAAGFPTFPVQLPTALNTCQDMFILPHADPTWANHGNLKNFVSGGGFLWVGCHAVSILEELDGNGDGIPDMDFLSSTGLINYANHVNAYPPYNYDTTSLADPIMQFLGIVDGAVSGGSEAVYLPYRGGSWRPTTKISTYDPDQADVVGGKSPGRAAKLAYGRGYGLESSGIVMYQGSHSFSGTSSDQIASQRAFLNLILWNASEKSVVVHAAVPSRMLGSTQINLTATATSSGTIAGFQWTSSCGGTFGTPTAQNTTFTSPPAGIQNTPCVIRLTAVDSCGRVAFDARDTTILGLPDLAVTVTPSSLVPSVGSNLDYTITANDVGGLTTVNSVVTFTLPTATQYTVTSIVTSPSSVICTARSAPNTNVYDCPVGDLDGCTPVSIVVHGSVASTGCFGVDVNGTTTSSDIDLGSNTASAQGCVTTSGNNPVLIKRVSPASPTTVNPGGTLTYALTLLNAGGAQLDDIHIYDPFPTASTTYVAGSASVTYRSYMTTIADSFVGSNYTGSTGLRSWGGPWTEIKDGNGRPNRGNIRVRTNNCPSTSCPNITAAVDSIGLQRPLSLVGATGATLSFTYRVPTAKSGQTALVQASGDGGSNWRTMATLSLATQVSTSTAASYAFQPSELTGNARIRFLTTGTSSALFVPDDISVQLQIAGTTFTSAGSTPASGNSWDLTQNLNGLLSLKPGESMTVTFRTSVNTGVAGGTAIANTANVTTTQTGVAAINSNTVTLSTAASATSAPVAAAQTVTLLEDVTNGTLGIAAPTDTDTLPANLIVTVQRLPRATQAVIYLSDGITPISVNQTLTTSQLTGLKISGAADFNGTADPFSYVVIDPQGNSSTGVATITLTAVNDAPVAYPDQGSTQKSAPVTLDPPGMNDMDVDGFIDDSLCDLDPATTGLQSVFTNAAGTWIVDTSAASTTFGSVTFTPAAGFTGTAALSYSSGDDGTPLPAASSAGGSNCSSNPTGGCLTIRVNAPPLAVADPFTVNSIGGDLDVSANDSDSDGVIDVSAIDLDPGTSGIQTSYVVTGKGTFTSLLTGRVRFVPVSGYFGSVSTNYTVDDFDGGTSNSVAISVTIAGCSTAADCDDHNDCTSDLCSTGTCVNANLGAGTSCNDGNPGTRTDVCDGAGACAGTVYTCTPGACESASLPNGTGCVGIPKANGTSCDDGSACTQTDACQSGTCTGSNPVICGGGDQCHDAGTCSPATGLCSALTAKADGTACSDGSACTQTDTCQNGTCTGSNPVVCSAVDQCHDAGTCAPATGTCSTPAKTNGTACSDGSACTQTDTCQSGTCTGSNPVVCSAIDQCHDAGTCVPATGTCSTPAKTNGTACSDGSACTQTDTCQGGACTGSNPVVCSAIDQCHDAGTCVPATGTCSTPAKTNGTTCSDGNACTQTDTCQGGLCNGNNTLVCPDPEKPTCDATSGQCGCNTNADCLATAPICDAAHHTCHDCLVDSECKSSQFCNTETYLCSTKLANGTQVPTIAGHTPNLTGYCSVAAATAVCESGVCDSVDNRCGYANPNGPCTQSNASVVCRSGVCDTNDSKCGYADGDGPCTTANAATNCRSGLCSMGGICLPPSACLADSDCAATQFCNTETNVCSPKLANEASIPSIGGHAPTLDGQCSTTVGLAVCVSSVCNVADDLCGYPNGDGPCTDTDAAALCRNAVCDTKDSLCGLGNGSGPCTLANADTICRSKTCSVSGVCQAVGTCTVDGDCATTQFCDTENRHCTPKLPNGEPVPTILAHDPVLNGDCSDAVAMAVCVSAVCDPADDQCGLANADGPCTLSDAAVVCRSQICDPNDSKCGLANGVGPCSKANASVTCRSGACSVSGVCQLPSACTVDGDCAATHFCNSQSRACEPKLANGSPIPIVAEHDPVLDGNCTQSAASAVCVSGTCDPNDERCGYTNGDGSCTASDAITVCRSGACDLLDAKCGYLDGDGPCVAGSVCRSGSCSMSGVCQTAGSCTVDSDCSTTQFCNSETHACSPKLSNDTPIPTIAGHTPALNGTCDVPVATAVCLAAVCDSNDHRCGYANGDGTCTTEDGGVICRSSVCDSLDSKCGYADGDGPCTTQSGLTICRSGRCSADGNCVSTAGCHLDGDCSSEQICVVATGRCKPRIPAGAGGSTATGGTATGGDATGGTATGGDATGGTATGGDATGGDATGGTATGGDATGGTATGGTATGGDATGGDATGGTATGGIATAGTATGGIAAAGKATGGIATGGAKAITPGTGGAATRSFAEGTDLEGGGCGCNMPGRSGKWPTSGLLLVLAALSLRYRRSQARNRARN